ncbi:MAG TPA: hypothetical protein ENL12_02090 [Dehalococcoidia bacterium]|nr:hypothetical protein [Dehalococcoidia bacterium]
MTQSITQAPELVERVMYPLMFDTYDSLPAHYTAIADVKPVTAEVLYGDRGDVLTNVGRPVFTEDGKEVDATEFGSGWSWRIKVGVLKRRIEIPRRLFEAANGIARVTSLLTDTAKAWGEYYRNAKDGFVAQQFMEGMLTAGSLVFDGSFPNEPDPFPKFIYDGGPWFDDAHPLSASADLLSNIDATRTLDTAGLEAAVTQFQTGAALDERGERINLKADTLLVGSDLQFTAQVLLESAQLPGGVNNDINTMQGRLNVVVNPFLTATGAWWLGAAKKGYRVYDQGAPLLEQQYEAKRQVFHIVSYSGFGAGVTNWRYWQSNNKAIA